MLTRMEFKFSEGEMTSEELRKEVLKEYAQE